MIQDNIFFFLYFFSAWFLVVLLVGNKLNLSARMKRIIYALYLLAGIIGLTRFILSDFKNWLYFLQFMLSAFYCSYKWIDFRWKK